MTTLMALAGSGGTGAGFGSGARREFLDLAIDFSLDDFPSLAKRVKL